jgi:hypothetical protein
MAQPKISRLSLTVFTIPASVSMLASLKFSVDSTSINPAHHAKLSKL